VSCAAGLAVLDVIEKEGLQKNASDVGEYLKERFGELRKKYPLLGGSPNPDMAEHIMNHMRQNGVLIGTTGQKSDVLKIRPPLVFEKEHADILLEALKKALEES